MSRPRPPDAQQRVPIWYLREKAGREPVPSDWLDDVDATIVARAALSQIVEAVIRAREELVTLRNWAQQQNAGDAFAEQVAHWATSHLENRLEASFDFGEDLAPARRDSGASSSAAGRDETND